MRKKLLSFVLPILFFGTIVNAQTKIWDFGNDTATWPLSGGIGNTPMVVDNLGLFPLPAGNINFGAITGNNATFPDGYTATQRFQMNGAGYPTGPFQVMPTQRYLFIDVSGACTVKVWFRPGSADAARTIYVTNGTTVIGQATSATSGGDQTILTAAVPATGRYYIYGDTACNLYKVEVTGATVNTSLSLENLNKLTTNVFGAGNQVYVQNVVSNTEVKVYGITGALVKSFNTTSDVNFELNKGLYIVNVKSEEGEKSVKVLMN
ncbi:T9SS type A sorting domain-containing protein [Flavobacterium azooxidireducens]|uniref:T9SS type A sorting domain-containing protein n=1 Tax=Flavobacterium azooxidireducens TaxID=1871076 RepID=A0ABY4KEV2_9FLAO|nr:T9SS type A sorting domain-containing protein [Flavobacterium azooxidireducens]UPQ78836.1 T9SS type A sorting domain-containing protein [Flavobacterium azooxidireducens]